MDPVCHLVNHSLAVATSLIFHLTSSSKDLTLCLPTSNDEELRASGSILFCRSTLGYTEERCVHCYIRDGWWQQTQQLKRKGLWGKAPLIQVVAHEKNGKHCDICCLDYSAGICHMLLPAPSSLSSPLLPLLLLVFLLLRAFVMCRGLLFPIFMIWYWIPVVKDREESKLIRVAFLRNIKTDVEAQRMSKAGREVRFLHKLKVKKQCNAATENASLFFHRQEGKEFIGASC